MVIDSSNWMSTERPACRDCCGRRLRGRGAASRIRWRAWMGAHMQGGLQVGDEADSHWNWPPAGVPLRGNWPPMGSCNLHVDPAVAGRGTGVRLDPRGQEDEATVNR